MRESRKEKANRLLSLYPDRVPIIIDKEKSNCEKVRSMQKIKFLVPQDLTVSDFMFVVRQRISLTPEQALFLFIDGKYMPPMSALISRVYKDYKNEDGFLYVNLDKESVFGKKNPKING